MWFELEKSFEKSFAKRFSLSSSIWQQATKSLFPAGKYMTYKYLAKLPICDNVYALFTTKNGTWYHSSQLLFLPPVKTNPKNDFNKERFEENQEFVTSHKMVNLDLASIVHSALGLGKNALKSQNIGRFVGIFSLAPKCPKYCRCTIARGWGISRNFHPILYYKISGRA